MDVTILTYRVKENEYKNLDNFSFIRPKPKEFTSDIHNSDRSWGPPSLLYNGYRVSFQGVKRPWRGVDHPPSSSAEVKERVELYLYFPSGPSWHVLGRRTLPLPLYTTVQSFVTTTCFGGTPPSSGSLHANIQTSLKFNILQE
jgi:hypothetical protein